MVYNYLFNYNNMKTPKELFEAIVNLSKDMLSPEKDEVKEVVEEEVVLAKEEEKKEVVENKETPTVEAPVVEQPAAVSKSEFDSAIAEIKEMYTKVLESISPSTPKQVPEALSEVEEEVKEEVKEIKKEVALEEVKEVKKEIVHDPESVVDKVKVHLHSQNRAFTTVDHVFNTLFKN